MIWFLVGAIVGGSLGFVASAFLVASKEADKDLDDYFKDEEIEGQLRLF